MLIALSGNQKSAETAHSGEGGRGAESSWDRREAWKLSLKLLLGGRLAEDYGRQWLVGEKIKRDSEALGRGTVWFP